MKGSKASAILLAGILCVVLATGCPRRPLRMVYDQGNCTSVGWISEIAPVEDNTYGQQTGDDFVLAEGNATITQIRWWGAYLDDVPVEDDFTFRLYDDSGGLVPVSGYTVEHHAGSVNRQVTDQFLDSIGGRLNVYAYTCNIPVTRFEPGRRYYLVILNNTGTWLWALNEWSEVGNELCIRRNDTTGPWGAYATDAAFQLWTNRR